MGGDHVIETMDFLHLVAGVKVKVRRDISLTIKVETSGVSCKTESVPCPDGVSAVSTVLSPGHARSHFIVTTLYSITLLVPYVWALWAYAMAGITFTSVNIRVEGDSVILDYKTRDGLTSL